jgi:hypothetical protein
MSDIKSNDYKFIFNLQNADWSKQYIGRDAEVHSKYSCAKRLCAALCKASLANDDKRAAQYNRQNIQLASTYLSVRLKHAFKTQDDIPEHMAQPIKAAIKKFNELASSIYPTQDGLQLNFQDIFPAGKKAS